MRSRLSTLLSLLISLIPLSAGGSEGEDAYRSAQVTCAIVAEMHFFQRADAIREINALRERLDKEPFLEGYKVLDRAIDAEICVNLALNEPDWRDRLEQIESEKAQREAEALNLESQTNTQSDSVASTDEQRQELSAEERAERARQEVENSEYASQVAVYIQRAIVNQWARPPSARNGMKVVLEIALVPSGDVVGVSVVESSGSVSFDQSAINAVEKVARFPEVKELDPALFERDYRRFTLIFRPLDLKY